MTAKKIIKILKELEEITTAFDITFNVSNLSWGEIGKIARFCGEKLLEFNIYEDTTEHETITVIRVRS